MELIVFGLVALLGGLALAAFVWVMIWKATGNAFDWLIHTFGNERAAAEIEAKWQSREGE